MFQKDDEFVDDNENNFDHGATQARKCDVTLMCSSQEVTKKYEGNIERKDFELKDGLKHN